MSKKDDRGGDRWLAGTAAVLLCLAFTFVAEGNVGGSFSWDEGVYLASARLVAEGHPLFRDVFSSQPPVFLETLAAAFRAFGVQGDVAQRVAIVFAVLALLATAFIASRILGPWAAPLAILALLDKAFFDEGVSVHAEMPALALGLVAIALLVAPFVRPPAVLLAGGFFALAVLAKLWIAPYALLCAALLIVGPPPLDSGPWAFKGLRFALKRLGLFALGASLTVALVLSRYDLKSLYAQVIHFHLAAEERSKDLFARTGTDVLFRFGVQNAFVGLLALLGALFLFRRRPLVFALLAAWALASGAFVLWHQPSFDRHALLLAPPLAILAAAGTLPLVRGGWRRKALALLAVVPLLLLRPSIALQLSHGRLISHREIVWTVPLMTQLSVEETFDPEEDEAVHLIEALSTPQEIVATDAPLLAFRAGRDVPPPLVDVSGTRILSGDIDAAQAIRASSGAKIVVLWGDRLNKLEGYRSWVQENYRRVARWPVAEGRREFFARD